VELDKLLAELESFGAENDRLHSEYARRMMNIPRQTGQFLQALVLAAKAQRILEIGTSNGYSTLWLARAARAMGGRVTTVERLEYKVSLARANFERSGLRDVITQVHTQAGDFLAGLPDASFDFIFLDSQRAEYPRWLPHVKRILPPGGLWVADNALSAQDELKPFFALVEADPDFTTSLVPVGKGEYLAVKALSPVGAGV
jgi:predicted O-methyltransferase YrrM